MARYITISAIGARAPAVDPNTPPHEAVDAIVAHLQSEIEAVLPDRPDLVVLPEVCDIPANYDLCGDAVLVSLLNARGDRALAALAELARRQRCYITYPAVRRLPDGTLRNSIQLIDRQGDVACAYDKYHPTLWELDAGILPGSRAVTVDCDFGRLGFAICFDLNFDEIRSLYVQARPDVLVFSSMYHGGLMQAYWAYTCRSHFAAAISGTGSAHILSPVGAPVASSTNYFHCATARVNLDCAVAHLDFNWERLAEMRARHGPKVRIADPGFLGSVLISSETDEFGAGDLAREFGIELLDDYFARALSAQSARRPGV